MIPTIVTVLAYEHFLINSRSRGIQWNGCEDTFVEEMLIVFWGNLLLKLQSMIKRLARTKYSHLQYHLSTEIVTIELFPDYLPAVIK